MLTTSAEAYVSSVGKDLSGFDLRSVDGAFVGGWERVDGVYPGVRDLEETILECKRQMIKKAKEMGAEVVVDMKPTIAYHQFHFNPVYMVGTALIPKK